MLEELFTHFIGMNCGYIYIPNLLTANRETTACGFIYQFIQVEKSLMPEM